MPIAAPFKLTGKARFTLPPGGKVKLLAAVPPAIPIVTGSGPTPVKGPAGPVAPPASVTITFVVPT